jgi:hypothetical protein
VLEFWELEQYMMTAKDWNCKSDDLIGHDVRRQYVQNRAIIAKNKRMAEEKRVRLKLAEAKAARLRAVKEGASRKQRAIKEGAASMTKIVKGAGAGVAAGATTRLAKGRVDQYLLKMNVKADEKRMASKSRGRCTVVGR